MENKLVLGFDQIGVEDNDLVGKKCANLGEMTKAGFRVPPGFAITLKAYEKFLMETGVIEEMRRYLSTFKADPDDVKKYQEASTMMRQIMESVAMPGDMANMIDSHYDSLCRKTGIADVAVSVRSAGAVSRPGQYETVLNVSGKSDVIKNVIKVWASTFNYRSLIWRAREGLPLEFDPIGVAVMKLVNASKAGVMLTLNPLNGDLSKIVIDANWGLGESVVSGESNSDSFVVDKVAMEVLVMTISGKLIKYVPDAGGGKAGYVDVPPEKQKVQCLTVEEILEISKLGKQLEKYYDMPQDVEWSIDVDFPFPENIFLVQTRAEKAWSKRKKEPVTKAKASALDLIVNQLRTGVSRSN